MNRPRWADNCLRVSDPRPLDLAMLLSSGVRGLVLFLLSNATPPTLIATSRELLAPNRAPATPTNCLSPTKSAGKCGHREGTTSGLPCRRGGDLKEAVVATLLRWTADSRVLTPIAREIVKSGLYPWRTCGGFVTVQGPFAPWNNWDLVERGLFEVACQRCR